MKTMILAAVAALSLGVGSAYAAGGGAGPAGWEEPHYGAQAFTGYPKESQTQFLGPNTVLGKMFHYSDSNHQVAAAATSAKGG